LSKQVPVLIAISVIASLIVGAAAASSGALDFIINPNVKPLINGTIINNDNKTYSILIQEGKFNVTTPPVPPVVNNTPPPVVNNTPPQPPTCSPTQFYNTTTKQCQDKPITDPNCPPTQFYNDTSKQCQNLPPVTPPPQPQPAPTTIKVIMLGDVADGSSGTSVFNAVKAQNADNIIILGDLGYASSLSWFKQTYGSLGNKLNCVLGNHEAANEDGSSSLESETKKYCANSYYIKKNSVLFLGFNTNGDLTGQATSAGKLLQSSSFMQGIKSVHIMSHKGCAVPPNSHHTVEVKSFCDAIKAKIPSTVKTYYDSAHNHVMSSSTDGVYKQSGAGGKSHYECGTDSQFNWCNNSSYGFLVYTIKPDGTTTWQFVDYNGRVLH